MRLAIVTATFACHASTPAPVHPTGPTVNGHVRSDDGAPVAGAEVALVRQDELADHVVTSIDGSFTLHAPAAGRYSVSAHVVGRAGAFVDGVKVPAANVDLALGAHGVTVAVHVTHREPLPPDAALLISRISSDEGDIWRAPIDPRTDLASVTMPEARKYRVRAIAPMSGALTVEDPAHVPVLDVAIEHPPTAADIGYVRDHAIHIASSDPTATDFTDLEPLGDAIGTAGVVGIGEATHGTREFFQLKHRLFEYLVTRREFTTLLFEGDQAECRRIEDFVQGGGGNAHDVVFGLGIAVWHNDELVELVQWMHDYNATAKTRVHFVGFDMQSWWPARRELVGFLARVDPAASKALVAALDPIEIDGPMSAVPAETHAAVDTALADAAHVVAAHADDPEAAAAARDATSLVQWHAYALDPVDATRDRAMATNIVALRRAAPHDKMMVWAHNFHIGRYPEIPSMGLQLAQALGTDYLALGFVLGGGTFRACSYADPDAGDMTVTPLADRRFAPASAVDAVAPFVAVGAPLLALDLRRLPVDSWFAASHRLREVGFLFTAEPAHTVDRVLASRFDIALFVAHSTSAHTPSIDCYYN